MPEPVVGKRNSLAGELGRVLLTEVVILGFFALPLLLGRPLVIRGMLLLLVIGIGFEVSGLLFKPSPVRRSVFLLLWGILYLSITGGYVPQNWLTDTAAILIILLTANIFVNWRIRSQQALLVYPLFLIPFISFMAFDPTQRRLLLYTYLIVESFDSFAYLGGKLLGRTKAFPKLSPKKTVEGLLAGLICAGGIGWFFASRLLPGASFYIPLLLFLIIISTLFGDLCASKIKRKLEIKDYGRILPFQGGLLDIYDSIIFTAPVVFIYLKLIG